MKFGEYLIKQKVINQVQLQRGLLVQKYCTKKIGRILRDLEIISHDDLNQHLSHFLKKPRNVNLSFFQPSKYDHEILKLISPNTPLMPLGSDGKSYLFGSLRFDDKYLESIEEFVGRKCSLQILDRESFDIIGKKFNSQKLSEDHNLIRMSDLSSDQKLSLKDPYISLFKECLEEAVKIDASDIHLEPKENSYVIRMRLHGDLQTWKVLDHEHCQQFTLTLKDLLKLDLSIVGTPQDSRASFPALNVDLRVNCLPIIYGEKIVVRLLKQNRSFLIDDIEFDEGTKKHLLALTHLKNGLVLISGPTGSGKTTTLYSLINAVDKDHLNVSTLEHPVEYRLPGINQVDVGSSKSLTFASSLRALMRQDPDVILLGEIRDEETAKKAFEAASTGHLVFSTVHANNPQKVIERILNLGVDRFAMESNLVFSAAQRLVKKLCTKCALPIPKEFEEIAKEISPDGISHFRIRNEVGCPNCTAGVVGRLPILSYLKQNEIKANLHSVHQVETTYTTLRDVALKKALSGAVDLREALEVA